MVYIPAEREECDFAALLPERQQMRVVLRGRYIRVKETV